MFVYNFNQINLHILSNALKFILYEQSSNIYQNLTFYEFKRLVIQCSKDEKFQAI